MKDGSAVFGISISPFFSKATYRMGVAVMDRNPIIYFREIDAEGTITTVMQSELLAILMSNYSSVCPGGRILVLDTFVGVLVQVVD